MSGPSRTAPPTTRAIRRGLVIAGLAALLPWLARATPPSRSRDMNAVPATERAAPTPAPPPGPFERQVIQSLREQPIDAARIEDLNLPDEFLRRLADRIIRASYQRHFRAVVRDPASTRPADPNPPTTQPRSPARPAPGRVRLVQAPASEATLAYRRRLPEAPPALRGFRAALGDQPPWPAQRPEDPPLRRVADLVAQRLATDGLPATLVHVLRMVDPQLREGDPAAQRDLLRRVGLPDDLLEHFEVPDRGAGFGPVLEWAREQAQSAPGAEVATQPAAPPGTHPVASAPARGQSVRLRWRPSRLGYQVAVDSGQHAIRCVRLQLTRGDCWLGTGDGSSVDIARQLVERLPAIDLLVSLEERFVPRLLETCADWPLGRPGRLTLIAEPLTVSQWTQDNAKVGLAAGQAVLLVPRYASRGEVPWSFVPGESFLADGLAAAGLEVVQSPLLFQGGNLLAAEDPRTSQRLLLIGEAELHRNMALGLSAEQVLEAFRTEFGVDRCVVLPAVSYHLDYEVSLRATPRGVLAFVNDPPAAATIILQIGIDVLERGGVLNPADAGAARHDLAARRWGEVVRRVGDALLERAPQYGRFPESLADAFSTGPTDSGVGNFQRFLLALDLALGWSASTQTRPGALPADPGPRAYLASLQRRDVDRQALHAALRELGFQLVPIPSLAEEERSIGYLNGLHDRQRYLMPAWGGLYGRLDAAAMRAFQEALGADIEVVPILCSESQRRVGGLHCAASALYAPP